MYKKQWALAWEEEWVVGVGSKYARLRAVTEEEVIMVGQVQVK